MNIGIKYCGGCNPHYDRTKYLNKIMESFENYKFEYAKENNSYDIILVINGCNRACADHSELKGTKIFINSETDYEIAIELLKNM